MTEGQHIGRLSDSLQGDEGSSAHAQRKALAALKRPQQQYKGPRYEIGDGDVCPLVPEHGKMLTIQGSGKQHCPHQSHDRVSRAVWPHREGFKAAVAIHLDSMPKEATHG